LCAQLPRFRLCNRAQPTQTRELTRAHCLAPLPSHCHITTPQLAFVETAMYVTGMATWWILATSFGEKCDALRPYSASPETVLETLSNVAAAVAAVGFGIGFIIRVLRHWNRDADFASGVEARGIKKQDWAKGKKELGVEPSAAYRTSDNKGASGRLGFRRHVAPSPKSPRVPRAASFRSGPVGSPRTPVGGYGSLGVSPGSAGYYGSSPRGGRAGWSGGPGSGGGVGGGMVVPRVSPMGSPQSPSALGRVSNTQEAEVYLATLLRYSDQQLRNRETMQVCGGGWVGG
jgi:hypothetical protein